jgi:DNA polymerase-4
VKTILHIDMDAFFAAVEQHDRPEFRGRPVVIGAPHDKRGVVSTCSYEARRFGVHSAMPSRTAYRLCPQAVFLPVRMERYLEVSEKIMEIFQRFTPLVEPLSCDEAFLDVTGARQLFGDGPRIARRIKDAVLAETGLTCSVGVAPTLFLAKIASELEKPDGLTLAPFSENLIPSFLAPLPIRRMWGAGKVTQAVLERHGIRTLGDLQTTDPARLAEWVGDRSAARFLRLAFGKDDREVEPGGIEKSLSRETTFETDLRDRAALEKVLCDLADQVGTRLRRAGFRAACAQIRIRWSDFTTVTRQTRLDPPRCDDISLRETALNLFRKETLHSPVRLIGFGVHRLGPPMAEAQPELFAPPVSATTAKRETLSRSVDRIRERYGRKSLRRGSSLE